MSEENKNEATEEEFPNAAHIDDATPEDQDLLAVDGAEMHAKAMEVVNALVPVLTDRLAKVAGDKSKQLLEAAGQALGLVAMASRITQDLGGPMVIELLTIKALMSREQPADEGSETPPQTF